MMTWDKYYLTEVPFREAGHIDPTLKDIRLNGKIFSKNGFEDSFNSLLSLIKKEKSICYLRAHQEVRGSGKSALLADIYWHLKKNEFSEYLPTWVTVHDYRTITQLFSRILDTFVINEIFSKIHETLEEVTSESITKLLEGKIDQPSPAVIEAVGKILTVPEGQIAWKYQNIKRSMPVSPFEIFSYILMMYSEIDKRRIVVFIDQFEEYVEYQRKTRKLDQLAQDLKDIYRMCSQVPNLTFVLTLHPSSEADFQSTGQELLNTYGNIDENSADLKEISSKQLVKVVEKYLKNYRTSNFPKDLDKFYPFTEEVVEYVAKESSLNCRIMLRIMRNCLMEAREQDVTKISLDFVKDPKNHQAIGLGVLES
jgi:hypothetical protein